MSIKVGDWIRFRFGDALVIMEVRYVDESKLVWPYEVRYVTDIADVDESKILEARPPAPKEKK